MIECRTWVKKLQQFDRSDFLSPIFSFDIGCQSYTASCYHIKVGRYFFFIAFPHEVPDESWASESNMMINLTVCGLCKKICLPLLTRLYHSLLRITSRSYHARIYRKHCAGNGTSSSATSRKSTSSTRNISSESWSNVQTCHWLWASASSTTRISSTCTPCTTRISPSLMLSWLSMDRRFSRWEKEKRLGMF